VPAVIAQVVVPGDDAVERNCLSDLPISEFLDRLASDAPTPGGGSVAALTGAQGAALGRMVAALTLGKPKFADVEARVSEIDRRLDRAGTMLRRLMDEDAAAYEVLRGAFKLDKADPQRAERIRQAAGLAGSVPLETATLCARVLADLIELVEIGNPLLEADAAAGRHLARAAILAAAANVRANVPLMSENEAAEIQRQIDGLIDGLPAKV
jgi:formiminotetrahydrofolate cyclodeaminase